MSSGNAGDAPFRITSAVIVTADRPEQLARAVESYLTNFKENANDLSLIVMDDSRCNDTARASLCAIAGRSSELPVRYCGISQKEGYLKHLIQCGIDPSVARFALRGNGDGLCSVGANRNCSLLDTAGESIFTADDDTVCKTAMHPEFSQLVRFAGHEDPRDVWFFPNREDLATNAPWKRCDVIAQHETLLGATLEQIKSRGPNASVDVRHACAHFESDANGQSPEVAVTMSGMVGDSGRYGSAWILLSRGETRERLLGESTFKTACKSREVLNVTRCATVSHYGECMSTAMGLANGGSDPLPPFCPVGRNEDGFFGMMIRLVSRYSFFGHIPAAIFHEGQVGRIYETRPAFRISSLLIGFLSFFAISPKATDMRSLLRLVGQELEYIAEQPDYDLWTNVRGAARAYVANLVARIDMGLRSFPECPPYWRIDVLTFREHMVRLAAQRSKYLIPIELSGSPESCAAKTRELIKLIGRLLTAWPDIADAARHLKTRGIRISEVVDPSEL